MAKRTDALADLLCQAMAVLVQLEGSRIFWPRPAAAGLHRLAPGLHPIGMEAHREVEVCLCVSGRARLELAGGPRAVPAGRAVVLRPGVLHCEGYAALRQPYSLLWLACLHGELYGFWVHHRDGRWREAGHQLLGRRAASHLTDCVMATQGAPPRAAARLRHCMAGILGEWILRLSEAAGARRSDGPLRCQPLLVRVKSILDGRLDARFTVPELAAMTPLSPNYLNRRFRQWTGQSIGNYILRRRMERAMELCGEGRLLIKQVAAETGYSDPLYFSRAFHRYFGRWPSTVRGAPVSSPPR